MNKEPLILFPAIRMGGMPGIENSMVVMRAEYDDHATKVAKIRRLTDGPAWPEGACATWTALYSGLAEFLADLEQHVRLENDVLVPQSEPR